MKAHQQKLTRQQKEIVGLLSIGTVLEYFDLMLYIHMAVLLNELFFPKTDAFTSSLISAFLFASTFVLRPIGALIFGYIGDNVGRRVTIIITTFIMSISCLIIANLPTYAQIGITASWIMVACRVLQGMSSMGEIIGAEIYLSEMIKPPKQYFAVTMIEFSYVLGTIIALLMAGLATSYSVVNWRIAFWFGAIIALIGSVARSTLKETPEFVDAERRIKRTLELANISKDSLKTVML